MPTEQKEFRDEGKVYIKKEAFRNMITHVLRFGNEAFEESVEVMGICIGKTVNGKDIELINAIPITHGKKISIGFNSEDYNAFSEVERIYAKQNLHAVGWYSSHPGWGLFFSDSAIINHRNFFQNDKKPYGFYIVFDHTLMAKDGNLGFEIYRLDDYSDEKNTEYHKIAYEIEIPNNLEYFTWVQKFVEDNEKEAPILIKEINELTELTPSELQEIPSPEKSITEVEPINSGFQEGTVKFANIFMDTFKSQLGNWTKTIKEGSSLGSNIIKNTTSRMKDKISSGISKVENWFNRNIDEISNTFKENITKYVDDRIEAQKELRNKFSLTKDEILKELNDLVETNFTNILNKIENNINEISEKIKNSSNLSSEIEEKTNKTFENISIISEEIDNFSNEMEKIVSTEISSVEQNFTKGIENLNTELNRIKKSFLEINKISEKLKEIVNSLKKE
ncbi:MAG: hypothetical protein ACFFAH_08525 [Promethearchaeota archaeon]